MKRLILLFALAAPALAQDPSPASQVTQPIAPPAANTNRTATVTVRPDCSAGAEPSECEEHSAIFSAPIRKNGQGHRTLIFNDLKTYGPSINFGNAGAWTVTQVIGAPHIVFGTSGIDQYEGANIVKNGTGDLAGLYLYVYGGGKAAQSDEGVEGIVVESGEINGYFHGTIAGGAAPGSTALTLAVTPDAPHNWAYTCDGCMLLDISKGTIAGSLNGRSTPFASTYLHQLPTTAITISGAPASLPLTHAWCTTLLAIPPTATAGVGTSRTVNCTLGAIRGSTPAFKAGGVVTISGKAYPEQVTLTAVGEPSGGVQSLTLLARNPNPIGSVIFQGGIAGQSLSFDANLAATGLRTSYDAFGSIDGVNLIYGSQVGGNVDTSHTLPRAGAEAETISSGFHLYPSAEIVANTAQPSAPMLEPNAVDWAPGDTVENPRFQSFSGVGIRDVCTQYTPTDDSVSSSCLFLQFEGAGISGTYYPLRIRNGNPLSLYLQGGGVLNPVPAMKVEGPFGDLLQFRSGPSTVADGPGSVINIASTAASDTTPFYLFLLPGNHGGGAAKVLYDPATLHISFPQGLLAGSLGTTSNCSSASSPAACGQASSGSFVIAAGGNSTTVVTAAVTANSQILITPDASLGAKLGVACNNNPATAFAPFGITARNPGHSFTLSIATNAASAPNCYSFTIVN
jgi:hypothetical protein